MAWSYIDEEDYRRLGVTTIINNKLRNAPRNSIGNRAAGRRKNMQSMDLKDRPLTTVKLMSKYHTMAMAQESSDRDT